MSFAEKKMRHINGYRGVIVDVDVDMVRLSNDAVTVREVVSHPGGVCVAALDENNNVTMVRQFRYPLQAELLELPAGKLEPGEDPFSAAARELEEETGLTAEQWTELGFIYTSPGFSTEKLYLYLARELRQGEAHPDENELLKVEKYPLSELVDRVMDGRLSDGKTVAGLLKASFYVNKD